MKQLLLSIFSFCFVLTSFGQNINIYNSIFDTDPVQVSPNSTGGYDVYDGIFDTDPGRIEPNGTGGYDVY
ncbi:MAG: hypothetical protein CMD38_01170, partial [Flavobacteriales bacterium]|nr:hypothetical protein [Flavobacteriales bacterium]